MTATGNRGKLKVGFQEAALLTSWNFEQKQDSLAAVYIELTANVGSRNGFWFTQSPQTLGLWMGQAWWVWSDIEVEYEKSKVHIRAMGNPEARLTF